MIVRLEPRGEAKSTAELYLSGKGTVPLSGPLYHCSVLFPTTYTKYYLLLFTEIELARVPIGEYFLTKPSTLQWGVIGIILDFSTWSLFSDNFWSNIIYSEPFSRKNKHFPKVLH